MFSSRRVEELTRIGAVNLRRTGPNFGRCDRCGLARGARDAIRIEQILIGHAPQCLGLFQEGTALEHEPCFNEAEKLPKTLSTLSSGNVVHEHVFERVREAIISGQFSPGSTISVRKLASEYGVSAMPAREAIRRLVAMGALEMTDTRRITLATMSQEKLAEIRVARLALEPELAVKAWEKVSGRPRAKKRLIDLMTRCDTQLDVAITSGDATDYARHNSEFHFALYRASEASVMLGLVESLWMQFGPFMRVVIGRMGTAWFKDDKHKDAIDAIRDDDPVRLKQAIRDDIGDGMTSISEVDFSSL